MYLYLNGRIIPDNAATLSVHDHGFLYGAGFFETFRTHGGRVFRLDRHLERLKTACERIRIHLPETSLARPGNLEPVLTRLLEANGLDDAVFRFTVSAGNLPGGLPESGYPAPTELLVPRPLPGTTGHPLDLHLLRTPRNSPEFQPRPKSLAYLNSLAGHVEMRERGLSGASEGIMVTAEGALAEGVTSNLFFVRDNRLLTPALANHILPGVTREAVLGLAEKAGVPAREGSFSVEDLTGADAIFITNSVRGPSPAVSVYGTEGHCLWRAPSAPDAIFERLHLAYREALP